MIYLLLFTALIALFFVYPFKTFYIFKNFHYCFPKIFRLFTKRIEFKWEIEFDNSCMYDLKSNDQLDENKLCGISYHFDPHIDSARFGWSWNLETNMMDIHTYCYVDSVRKNEAFTSVPLNEKVTGVIIDKGDSYYMSIESKSVSLVSRVIPKTKNSNVKFLLDPYFGGNMSAPHTMKIYLKLI